ncbi:DNA-directed RNA polymerase subunit beta' [Striga asiatica]|uniref:DNA-directed RNA polymerase subunit beta n=1 Tax=Striga asiatica TaxID=4170 RepID=A0A5A7P5A9_STRAF|nr:DNA-directed RNA polymerase subunit beta' [Striga asiatica]
MHLPQRDLPRHNDDFFTSLHPRHLLGLLERLDQSHQTSLPILTPNFRHQILRHVSRRHLNLFQHQPNLAEQLVRLDFQIILGKNLKRLKPAIRELNVLVHPPSPDKCWVELLHVVRRENNNPFPTASRPKPVNKVQKPGQCHLARFLPTLLQFFQFLLQFLSLVLILLLVIVFFVFLLILLLLSLSREIEGAVDVLNNNDRLSRRVDKKLPELGVVFDRSQLKIVHVVLEKISHGGYHGRLAGPRRPEQEVSPFPSLSDFLIVILGIREFTEIVDDVMLFHGIHGQSVESGRVLECHVAPQARPVPAAVSPVVGVELPAPLSDGDGLSLGDDVWDVF